MQRRFQKAFFIVLSILFCSSAHAQLYPQPQLVQLSPQRFVLQRPYLVKGNIAASDLSLLNTIVKTGTGSNTLPFEIKTLKENDPLLQRSGAYRLQLSAERITLEAVDRRSVFYALQTLQQLAEKNNKGQATLPTGEITDFPDVAFRGTVEGFYGEPWSHADRLEQLRFYGKFKLNTYIYGPKDDPYHSSPHWRDAYPQEKAAQIKELASEAQKNAVDFVWAIHPGKDIKWNSEDSNAVLQKFEKMYALGVRSFAVFFDDISGAGTDARRQAGLLNYLQHRFVEVKGDVTPLIMCPTEYNKAWSNKKEGTYLDILGEQLHPAVQIMWTGNTVVADIATEGLEWVNKRIRRPAFVWWNFPVSDYVRDHLLLGPAYGLDTIAAPHISGFVSNPMDKAEASKLAVFSVALYAWNMKRYDPRAVWRAAIREVMPEAPEAFELFASHNSDPGPNGHRYRREESVHIKPIIDSFLHLYQKDTYSASLAKQIKEEYVRMLPVSGEINEKSRNKRLVEQLSPWLIQYNLLAQTGVEGMGMIKHIQQKNLAAAWENYLQVSALLDSMQMIDKTLNQNPYQPGVKTGSLVMMPLVKKLFEQSAEKFENIGYAAGAVKESNTAMQVNAVYSNAEKLRFQPLRSSNEQIAIQPLLEVVTLAPDEYVGLQLHSQLRPTSLHLNLENNNLQSWGKFETSEDGQQWQPLAVTEKRGKGGTKELKENVRYVRFINNSDKLQSFYLRELRLEVQPATEGNRSVYAVDGSVGTWQTFSDFMGVTIPLPSFLRHQPLALLLKSNGASFTITGTNSKGESKVLYAGKSSFVQIPKSKTKDITVLTLTTESQQPLRIYEVLKSERSQERRAARKRRCDESGCGLVQRKMIGWL